MQYEMYTSRVYGFGQPLCERPSAKRSILSLSLFPSILIYTVMHVYICIVKSFEADCLLSSLSSIITAQLDERDAYALTWPNLTLDYLSVWMFEVWPIHLLWIVKKTYCDLFCWFKLYDVDILDLRNNDIKRKLKLKFSSFMKKNKY